MATLVKSAFTWFMATADCLIHFEATPTPTLSACKIRRDHFSSLWQNFPVLILRIETLSWFICARQNYQSSLSHYESSPSKIKPKFLRGLSLIPIWRSAIELLRPSIAFDLPISSTSNPKTQTEWQNFQKIKSFNTRIVPKSKGCDLFSKKNHPVHICPRCFLRTLRSWDFIYFSEFKIK